jgi:hypothetical protein
VFYIQDESEPRLIECGDKLGDMTNELKPGEFIREFVSAGPKNYAYKICNRDFSKDPKTVCKVRGITLNYTTSQLVNFNVIRDMILKREPDVVNVHSKDQAKEEGRECLCITNHRT